MKNLFHIIKFSSQFQIFILFSVDRITHLIVKLSSPVLPTPPSHQPSSQSPLLLPPLLTSSYGSTSKVGCWTNFLLSPLGHLTHWCYLYTYNSHLAFPAGPISRSHLHIYSTWMPKKHIEPYWPPHESLIFPHLSPLIDPHFSS